MVFKFDYSSESLDKRNKAFGRLSLITAILFISLLIISSTGQASDFGWNIRQTEITTTLNDISSFDFDSAIAVGDQGEIISTGDAGITWTNEISPLTVNLKSIDILNTTIIAVGDQGTIIKRDTTGNWIDISPSSSSVNFRTVSIAESNTDGASLVFVGGQGGEILKSTNGGNSWKGVPTPTSETINSIDFFNSTFGLAVGTGGLIIGTLDGGISWEVRDTPSEAISSDFNGVVFKSHIRSYIVGTNGIFLRSSIGDNPIIGFVWKIWDTDTTQDFLSVDASSVNKVWVTGLNGLVIHTKDGGNLFKFQEIEGDPQDLNGLTVVDGDTSYIAGSSGTVLFTATGGESASEQRVVKNYDDPRIYLEAAIPLLIRGFLGMIRIIFFSMILGFSFGIIIAVMKTMNYSFLRILGTIYTDIFRNTPLLVQILIIHFGLIGTGIDLSFGGRIERAIISSIISLGLNSGAYQAEIIRSGILAIPTGQMEAGRSLGLNYFQTMRYIILPQAIRIVIPPLGNEFVNLTLNSSLASLTGLDELVRAGRLINALTFKIFQTWVLVAMFYFVITYSLTNLLRYTEKKSKIPGLGLGEV